MHPVSVGRLSCHCPVEPFRLTDTRWGACRDLNATGSAQQTHAAHRISRSAGTGEPRGARNRNTIRTQWERLIVGSFSHPVLSPCRNLMRPCPGPPVVHLVRLRTHRVKKPLPSRGREWLVPLHMPSLAVLDTLKTLRPCVGRHWVDTLCAVASQLADGNAIANWSINGAMHESFIQVSRIPLSTGQGNPRVGLNDDSSAGAERRCSCHMALDCASASRIHRFKCFAPRLSTTLRKDLRSRVKLAAGPRLT